MPQYKDLYRRTIEISQRAQILRLIAIKRFIIHTCNRENKDKVKSIPWRAGGGAGGYRDDGNTRILILEYLNESVTLKNLC